MLKDYPLSVPANSAVRPRITGNYINLVSSAAPLQPLRVRAFGLDSQPITDINMRKGDRLKTGDFSRLEIDNPTGADINAVFVIGDGDEFESAEGEGSVSVLANSTLVGLTPLTFTGGDTQSIAANASRKSIEVLADLSNTGLIYIGTTDGAKGIPLPAGATFNVNISGAINLYGDTAGDVLHILEIS